MDIVPIFWKDNSNTGKTTITVNSKKKLSKLQENAIKGYVLAQCYPDSFEQWAKQTFGPNYRENIEDFFKKCLVFKNYFAFKN
jgi:hypothetical protein